MVSIDKLETKIEGLIEKISALNFDFRDANLEKESQEAKESVIQALEDYLELANQDYEQRSQGEDTEAISED